MKPYDSVGEILPKQMTGLQFSLGTIISRSLSLIGLAALTLFLQDRVITASNEAMNTPKDTGSVQPTPKRSIDIESLTRKKFKTDDLPLSAAQHAVIDKLLHSFKKKGGFDSVRKQIWSEFNDGVWLTSKQHT